MGLNSIWKDMLDGQISSANDAYWNGYFEKERNVYLSILEEKNPVIKGTITEMAVKYNLEPVEVVGFIDGINTSLETMIDLESDTIEDDSSVTLNIIWDKLYMNMLAAKAPWLYELKQWDEILSADIRLQMRKKYNLSQQAVSDLVGRNDPCPCGSGKKYKKCCGIEK